MVFTCWLSHWALPTWVITAVGQNSQTTLGLQKVVLAQVNAGFCGPPATIPHNTSPGSWQMKCTRCGNLPQVFFQPFQLRVFIIFTFSNINIFRASVIFTIQSIGLLLDQPYSILTGHRMAPIGFIFRALPLK